MSDAWERTSELFAAAAALPEGERSAYLERVCGHDRPLLMELTSLLRHHDAPVGFLEQPALGVSFRVDAGSVAKEDPLLGRSVGPYRIEAQIGAGGVGTVYRGVRRDGLFEQTVAIKIVHPMRAAPVVVRRFRREWQALASLAHPSIARLLDAGVSEDGTPYLVLEYIEGQRIDVHCDQRRLTVSERLGLLEQVASAVQYAHQHLVVHCDLKPANIMVTASGVPKLLDFGIARILTPDDVTITSEAMMTPDYASPEQLRGEQVSTASDVYSLGVLLHELLVGCRPDRYTTRSTGANGAEPVEREPGRASAAIIGARGDAAASLRRTTARRLRRSLAGELDTIVLTAMRTDPARRYGSAGQLAQDVRRHLEGRPIVARPDSFAYRLRKLIARNPLGAAMVGLLVVAILGGAAATGWQAHLAVEEAAHAGVEAMSAHRLADIVVEAFLVSGAGRAAADRDEVRRLLARQLERARRELVHEHHVRANLIDALGRVYGRLGMFDEAEQCIAEARQIRVDSFGEHSLEVAVSVGSAGELALRRGDLLTAKAELERALSLQLELPAGVHTDVSRAANDLAVVLRKLGEHDRAAALHEDALEARRRLYGDRHASVAESLNNLAAIDLELRRFDVAERRLREVLGIRRETLGDGDPLVAQAVNNLAIVVFQAGRFAEAEALLREAVTLFESTPGGDPEALAMSLFNLADGLRMRDAPAEALPYAQRAVALLRSQRGDVHPETAKALTVLAGIQSRLGNHEAAIGHHAEAVAAVRALFPAGHVRVGATLCAYGSALVDGGRAADAEPVYREAVELLRAVEPQPELLLGSALYGLGIAAAKKGRRSAAESALHEAAAVFRRCGSGSADAAARLLRQVRQGR